MRLNVIERGPPAPRTPPLVMLHGLLGQARNFGWPQKALAEERRVLALDLRNHGTSPHAPGMTYASMAEDVHQTLAEAGALPCFLLGHSMGGKVAMRLALDMPGAVAGLIVADIAPKPYLPRFRPVARAMLEIPLDRIQTRAQAADALAEVEADPRVRAFLVQGLEAGDASFGHALHWRIGLREIADGLPDIEAWQAEPRARFDGPAVFIAGGRSAYIASEDWPVIRALFPKAEFATLAGAGHWLHADQPEAFVQVVRDFMHNCHQDGSDVGGDRGPG